MRQRFKLAILNMLKEPKESMSEDLKESMGMISHEIDNINKETEILKKAPNRKFEVDSTITKMKLQSRSSRAVFNQEEERINETEDRSNEIIQSE